MNSANISISTFHVIAAVIKLYNDIKPLRAGKANLLKTSKTTNDLLTSKYRNAELIIEKIALVKNFIPIIDKTATTRVVSERSRFVPAYLCVRTQNKVTLAITKMPLKT